MGNSHESTGVDFLHDDFVPSDVRESDAILTRIRLRGEENEFLSARTWRLSPLGIEIVRPELDEQQWQSGTRLDLQIVIEGKRSEFSGLIVAEQAFNSKIDIIGIRFLADQDELEAKRKQNERRAMRWMCSEEHLPKAVAASPGKFNEFLGFKIKNISSNGLLLVTTTKNSFLIPGMRLTLSINLPMVGDAIIKCQLVWMRVGRDGAQDVLEIGASMLNLGQTEKGMLGQYLVQFSKDLSLPDLISDGFAPRSISQGIEFYALKTETDYNQVLQIRSKAGDDSTLPIEHFVHPNDQNARIVVGRIGNSIVVSARVKYPELKERLLCEDYMSWDDSIARTDQMLETEGIVLDCPATLEDDTLLALFRYICTSCTSATRQTVLLYTERDSKFFEDIGWVELSNNNNINTLVGNAYEAIKGKNTSPIKWNYVWRRSAEYMLRTGEIRPAGTDRLMLKIYFAFGSVTKLLFRLRAWRSRINNKHY